MSTARSTPSVSHVGLTAKVGDTVTAAELNSQVERAMLGKSFRMTTKSAAAAGLNANALVSRSSTGAASMHMTEEVAGEKVEVIYVHDVMYLSVPAQSSGWLAIRQGGTDALSRQLGPMLGQMKQGMSGDLGDMKGVVWKVLSIDPAGTTYRAHVSAAAVRAKLAKSGLSAIAGKSVPAAGEDVTEVIAANHLPVSTTVTIDGVKTLSLHYGSWGPAVDIKVPRNVATPPAA